MATSDGGPGEAVGDAGLADAGAADAGTPLWPLGATRVEATSRGGFPTPYCDSDAGQVEGSTYVLTLPDGRLTWSVCTGYVAPRRLWTGALTLDAGQVTQFEDAMAALVRSDRRVQGADAYMLTLLLTTPEGTLRYEDDFYAFLARPDTTYVKGTQAIFTLLDGYAGVSW